MVDELISDRKDFGQLLQEKLIAKYGTVTQASLRILNMGFSSLGSYINGMNFPMKRAKLEMLCEAAGIPIASLDLHSLVDPKYHSNFGLNGQGQKTDPSSSLEKRVRFDVVVGEEPTLPVSKEVSPSNRKAALLEFGKLLHSKLSYQYGDILKAARRLGINYRALYRVCNGHAFFSDQNRLQLVCSATGISMGNLDLLTLVDSRYYERFSILKVDKDTKDQAAVLLPVVSYDESKPYQIGQNGSQGLIVGNSKPMLNVFDILDKIVNNPDQSSVVLITGETGTGKELVARAIHYNGPRAKNPFLGVNITALPETLLESELFGHSRGAYTGAVSDAKGFFEEAGEGTLFLDEIGSMLQTSQARVLRVLQEREFYRIGETKPRKFSGRVLVATREKLEELVRNGDFREDLYYRINVVNVHLPSLAERKEDIPLLFSYFVRQHNSENKTKYSEELNYLARERVNFYSFPGNVRELQNLIKRAIFFNSDSAEVKLERVLPVDFKAKSPEQS